MSIANNYRKLGKKARRAKKYKSNKKNGFYAFRGDSSRHTPNSGTKNCIYSCTFYFIGKSGKKCVIIRDGYNSKLVKNEIKKLLSKFAGSAIIGYIITKRYKDGTIKYSYKRTLENWDRFMSDFSMEYPNAKFLGYINKDRL